MNQLARRPGPTLPELFALFPPVCEVPQYKIVPGDAVPPPYHRLLVHEHHMTVTVEAHHRDRVYTDTVACLSTEEWYARMILLRLESTDRPIQFGIVRVYYHYLIPEVRAAILAGRTPLGRILIQHNVLRRIEPTAYLRVSLGPTMQRWFDVDRPAVTYGRLGFIYCDEQPAVELLEIVAPE
jgi:hypothetical protein